MLIQPIFIVLQVPSSASDSCLIYVKMTKEQNYVRFYPILLYLNKSLLVKSNLIQANTGENAWKIPQLEGLLLIQSNQTVQTDLIMMKQLKLLTIYVKTVIFYCFRLYINYIYIFMLLAEGPGIFVKILFINCFMKIKKKI